MLQSAQNAVNFDSWSNLYTKMGVLGRDKRVSSTVDDAPVFTERAEMDALYHGNDLAKKIVDLPAREMTRRWIRMRSSEMKVKEASEFSRKVLDDMESRGVRKTIQDALAWASLYGGCCVIVGVDDGKPVHTPLDLKKARSIKYMNIIDRHEMQIKQLYTNPLAPNYGKPELYQLFSVLNTTDNLRMGPSPHAPPGQVIHASRMLHFDGTRTGRWRAREVNGNWADSVFVSLIATLRGHDSVWQSSEVLMQDFAQAVIKLEGLHEAMSTHGEAGIMARLTQMETTRSTLRALLLDAEHEDFERKPTPMTGLPDVLEGWMHRLSAATNIPVTLLYGRSPAGQNATGESDFRIFYDWISAKQETDLQPQLEKLIEILLNVNDGPTNGVEPESWEMDFLPLWRLNELEESQRRKAIAETDEIYINTSVTTPEAVTRARFAGEDYSAEMVIDEEAIEALVEISDKRTELELNPPKPEPTVAPAAAKPKAPAKDK